MVTRSDQTVDLKNIRSIKRKCIKLVQVNFYSKCLGTEINNYVSHNWAMSSKKVHSNMSKMPRFRSSCTYAKYYPGLCSPFMHSMILLTDIEG